MTILDTIIKSKKRSVQERKKQHSISSLESSAPFKRTVVSLSSALMKENSTGIIAEFKRRSPSKGIINDKVTVKDIVQGYAENGAAAISVLTDEEFFGGSVGDFAVARETTAIPLLRKDFIVDEFQLVESKAMGADVILLIAACLSPAEVKRLAKFARNLGLEVLLELHDEQELSHICDEVNVVGINNRNLKTFEVNIERSLAMAEKIPAGKIKIAESGIHSIDDILLFKENGFRGFLIGEFFMKQENPTIAFADFTKQLKAKAL